jgi:chromosome segregation protein
MLERQSRKAHRYRELSGRIRELDLSLTREDLEIQEEEFARARAQLEALRTRFTESGSVLAETEARLSEGREERLRLEREVVRVGDRLHELRTEIQGLEGRLEYERREREELLALAARREEEIGELDRQAEQHRGAEVTAHRERSELDVRLHHAESDGAQRREELERLSEGLARLQGHRDALGRRLLDLSTEGATLGSRIESLTERQRELERGLRGPENALEAGLVQADATHQEENALATRLGELLGEREALGRQLAALLNQKEQAAARLSELEAELEGVREAHQRSAARLQSLEETEREASDSPTWISERLEEPDRERIQGLLAHVLEVREGYEHAVESVLGSRLQALLVETAGDALRTLERLRAADAGRATILAAGSADLQPRSGFVPLGEPLLESVDAKPPYRSLATRLLQDVYVVEELAEAVDRYGLENPPALFVTRGGDLLDRSGALTGGARPGPGPISRSVEIRELRAEYEVLDERRPSLEERRRASLEHEAALERDVENTRSRYHAAELAVLQHEKDLERVRERRKAALESVEASRDQKARVLDEVSRLEEQLAELRERARSVGEDRTAVEGEVERVSAEAVERSHAVDRVDRGLVQRQVELASLRERREQLDAAHQRVRDALREAEDWIRRRQDEVREARERIQGFGESAEEGARRLAEALQEEEALRGSQDGVRGDFEAAVQAAEELEQEHARLARERDAFRERMSGEEVRTTELRLATEQTTQRVRERYGVDLSTYEIPAEHRDQPRPVRQAELDELRQRRDALGPVHHGAIEEYEEVSERFRFLSEQKADIEASVERLRSAIARINRTSRARFRETFEAVDREFRRIFPRLFQGGRAYLALTEAEDVLDAGIEIVAQPPGKKLQNMNLLSGGEKALTAIALLFAVFNVKPSPFFLLDEVDAALDDANVGRFDELMREMAPRSQFLLITHNKSTIEAADTLYGVTMEEPGVSKVVSVELVS